MLGPKGDGDPGALLRLAGDQIPLATGLQLSCHQASVVDLLWAARATGCYPDEVVLWGIRPGCTDVGCSMTAAVQAQLGALVRELVMELRRWDVVAVPVPC